LEHDERSRAFPARKAAILKSKTHHRYGPVLDQGDLGSCTGNAMVAALMTTPLHVRGRDLAERDAVNLYKRATQIDGVPGEYPPEDTGSTGLAVAKAAKEAGLIREYRHAFGLQQCLAALVLQPVIVGTVWTEEMFDPDPNGFIKPKGEVVGGHEYCLIALNVTGRYVTAVNSWGPRWGLKGRFRLAFDDLDVLLRQQGDVTVPVE
jgi:hypothetical protein